MGPDGKPLYNEAGAERAWGETDGAHTSAPRGTALRQAVRDDAFGRRAAANDGADIVSARDRSAIPSGVVAMSFIFSKGTAALLH